METLFFIAIALVISAIIYKSRQQHRTRSYAVYLSEEKIAEMPEISEQPNDFICLHMGEKGTIASAGGVSVRATKNIARGQNGK